MLKLALRNIFRQRTRAGLTLAAIAFGVAGLLLIGGFFEDMLLQLRESTIHSQLAHLQIYKRGRFENGARDPFKFEIDKPDLIEHAVDTVPGVVARANRLSFSGLMGNGRGQLPIFGEGLDIEREALIGSGFSVLAGRQLAVTDKFGIMVGEGLASALKLKVGDTVNVVLNTREGAVNSLDFRVVGIFRSVSKEYDARTVRVPLRAAQELAATSGVNAVVVLLEDTDQTGPAQIELEAKLPAGFEVKTWQDLADFYNSTVSLYQRQFLVLQIIVAVMVLLSVANSVNMTLRERTQEFGIMRALGRTGSDVFRLAVLETTLLGAIGAAMGAVVGALLAAAISMIGIAMPPPPNSESGFVAAIRIAPTILATAFALGLLASIAASLLPARHLARIPVVDALRRGV